MTSVDVFEDLLPEFFTLVRKKAGWSNVSRSHKACEGLLREGGVALGKGGRLLEGVGFSHGGLIAYSLVSNSTCRLRIYT